MCVLSTSMLRLWCRALSLGQGLLAGSHRMCFVLLCGVTGLVLAGCAATTTSVSPSSSRPPAASASSNILVAQRQALARAEELRSSGQLYRAQQAFANFVQQYPSSALTDDAMLALGQISTALGDDRTAQRAYEQLMQRFPTSENVPQAYLELGKLFYQARNYDRSLAALQQALSLTSSPERRAVAHYYLGMMARDQQRYAEAITELQLAAATSSDTDLVSQAHTHISNIVRDHLTLADLQQLARQYPATYPGDLVLSRLAQLYREAGNEVDEMAVLQRFTAAFPDHPEIPVAMARLDELQAAFTTDRTKIGILLPLSGEGSQYGQSALRGVELALTTWQEHHPDVELSLVVRDSHNSSMTPSDALRGLVQEAHVIGVVGPLFSQAAFDLAPLTEELRVPLVSSYAPDGQFPALSSYTFRNSLTDALQARFLASYAVHTLNLRRFAVFYPDEPYGVALKDRFIEHIIQLQGEVVAVVPYPPDATDFSAQIKRLGGIDDETLRDLRAGAETVAATALSTTPTLPPLYEAIFLPGYYDTVGLIAPELAFYNITDVQLLGTDGWNAPDIVNIGEQFVEGAIFVDGFFTGSSAPQVQEFVEQFQRRYQTAPNLLAAQAYDAIWMIAQVLRDGAHTRTQLRDGLLHIQHFAGVSGTIISMQPDGDANKIPYVLTIRGGQIVQLN
jgi:branched-chain amino acid transport system substrate-binding protein